MSREEIRSIFEQTGWEIADRGDDHVLVGEASNLSLSILAYDGAAIGSDDPEFMLYDRERDLAYWVRVVPTPTTAAVLIEAHGDRPEEDTTPGDPGRPRRGAARMPPSSRRFTKSIEGAGRPTDLQESMLS